MRKIATVCIALAGLVALDVGMAGEASARRWNPVGRCYAPIDGLGTGHGVFGRGSARARIEARRNWEQIAASKYGYAASRFYFARDINWDCKKGAILTAKCVVTAIPCEARTRG